jgi:hypothetical protein
MTTLREELEQCERVIESLTRQLHDLAKYSEQIRA